LSPLKGYEKKVGKAQEEYFSNSTLPKNLENRHRLKVIGGEGYAEVILGGIPMSLPTR